MFIVGVDESNDVFILNDTAREFTWIFPRHLKRDVAALYGEDRRLFWHDMLENRADLDAVNYLHSFKELKETTDYLMLLGMLDMLPKYDRKTVMTLEKFKETQV